MKQIVVLLLVFVVAISFPAFAQNEQVVVSFISHNAYGNNLYIDNLTIGTQFDVDAGTASIVNIRPDTNYAIGSSSILIAPRVSVINLGKNDIVSPFTVTYTATPGGYTSTKTVNSLARGQFTEVTFDNLTIPLSTSMIFTVVSNLAGDLNRSNDTLRQSTIVFPGTQRKVLLEEWTSSTCGPCASNNPTIDAFILAKFDSIVAVKYHVGWPSPGNDPMYLHNPTQAYDRRYYYGVNAVPHVIMDGTMNPSYPYSNPPSLPTAFAACITEGTPISLSVVDTRLANDTIQANVAMTVHSPLQGGNYKLRVQAVERKIHYTTAPGSNGEVDFYDVFRRAYPTSDGTVIPTSVGTHNFTFKYKMDTAVWVDSMIYTIAFIQNDLTKQIMTAAKGRDHILRDGRLDVPVSSVVSLRDRCASSEILPVRAEDVQDSPRQTLDGVFGYEIFEGGFPPNGWRVRNPDNGITWESYSGVSGPSFGGTKAVRMDLYSYSSSGQTDTLYSATYTGLRPVDSVKFDWAYAMYSASYQDRLVVKVSKDGGATFPYTIFDRSGNTLATAPTTTAAFVPSGSSQWATFAYSLAGIVNSVEGYSETPVHFRLAQNYPNPFNPSTLIEYSIPRGSEVRLAVYDVLGRLVTTLVSGWRAAGNHAVSFDASTLTSGVYFYKITAGEFSSVKKMVLTR